MSTKFEPMTRGQYAYVLIALALLVALGLIGLAYHSQQNEEWHHFRADHHCQARSRIEPPAGLTTAPGQTTWVCDDGQTYVKNDD